MQVKEYRTRGDNPLVLFSGDAYNPSLMSTITLGAAAAQLRSHVGCKSLWKRA